jgi:hypothetical protein
LEPTVRGTLVLGDVRDMHKHRCESLLANALDAAQRTAGITAMAIEAASEHDLNWAANILELGH